MAKAFDWTLQNGAKAQTLKNMGYSLLQALQRVRSDQ
jgi:hypothetical protein